MIVRPENMDFSNQNFSCIVYGAPGVGKTTLALSAPDPVLIDFDHGVSRVKAMHRKPTIIVDKYEDVLNDIESPEMKEFKTIVIDTGGSFVTYLQDWAMRSNPAANRQKNGAISLKGFGAVKAEFARFTEYVKKTLNKNVIFVFHSEEKQDKDGNPQQRLMCEGASKNTVWNSVDFGGYVQMIGAKREICFSPEQEFFAKGTHGIEGHISIPTLNEKIPNDFMTKIFKSAQQNIKSENEQFLPVKNKYEQVMAEVDELIDGISDADTANKACEVIKNMEHALTSKTEAASLLNKKAKQLGLSFDKASGLYL